MGKLYENERAEQEANVIAQRFMNSSDVVGDMGRAYDTDFSNLTIHTDASADAMVRSAGRDAMAKGSDIYFASGIYESSEPAAKGLVAHELAHTMQQGIVDGGEGAVMESAPVGAEQGGILDWFKGLFGKKKPTISAPLVIKKNQSAESTAYMEKLRLKELDLMMSDKVAESDAAWGNAPIAKNEDGSDNLQALHSRRVDAFLPYRFRSSKTALAGVDAGMRRNLFGRKYTDIGGKDTEMLSKDMQDRLDAMTNSGFDFAAQGAALATGGSAKSFTSLGSDAKQVKYTPEMLQFAGDFLGDVEGYLNTDLGKKYSETMIRNLRKAKMFQEGGADASSYFLHTVLNGEAGKMTDAAVRADAKGPEDANRRKMMVGTGSMIMQLPLMAQQPWLLDSLPEDVRDLFNKYMDICNRLTARIQ